MVLIRGCLEMAGYNTRWSGMLFIQLLGLLYLIDGNEWLLRPKI